MIRSAISARVRTALAFIDRGDRVHSRRGLTAAIYIEGISAIHVVPCIIVQEMLQKLASGYRVVTRSLCLLLQYK